MKFFICRFLVGMVWCALIVNAQDTAPDYVDYYDEAQIDEALPKDLPPSSGDAVPKEKEMAGEEATLDEASVTEEPVSTTSEPTTPKAKSKLVNIKPRDSILARRTQAAARNNPPSEVSTTSPDVQDNKPDSTTPRSRGSRRRGTSRTANIDAVTTEAPEEEAPPSKPNRFRPRSRPNVKRIESGRSSVSTTTEETTTEASGRRTRLRGGKRNRPTPATDAEEKEPLRTSIPSTRHRQANRGNNRRKLRPRHKIRFQSPTFASTTPSPPPQVTNATTTTMESAPASNVTKTTTMAPAPESQEIEVTTMAPAPESQEIEVTTMALAPALEETDAINMAPAPAPQVTKPTITTPAPVPEVTKPTTMVPAPLPQVTETTTKVPALAPKPVPAVVYPKPIRIVSPAKPAPAVAPPTTAQRGSSRFLPPKDPAHPIVQTTQAPSSIFSPPLSSSVKSRSRVSIPTIHKPIPSDATQGPTTLAPVPKIETTTSKHLRLNYGAPDIRYVGGSVVITEIGTVEDSPPNEVRLILSGFGSRRRGLGRPQVRLTSKKATVAEPVFSRAPVEPTVYDQYDDYYYYEY